MGYYYLPNLDCDLILLSNEESRHLIKVMRYKTGDFIYFSDGKGRVAKAQIIDDNRNECKVSVIERMENVEKRQVSLHIAVSPTKNADRMEWFVEKAVEIGIEKISFLICEHSERKQIDLERMNRIAISALKQSSATFLPEIQLISFRELLEQYKTCSCDKFIAWCSGQSDVSQLSQQKYFSNEILLLIGPEGDFSQEEIKLAKETDFKEIKLGNKILRTETAALYGTCIIAAQLLEK